MKRIALTNKVAEYLRAGLIQQGKKLYCNYPWRSASNKWHALAAEVMLQRTNADQVKAVYLDFAGRFSTPAEFLADKNYSVFKNLGLHWRDAEFRKLAVRLLGKKLPVDRNTLLDLPGVGTYIAAAFQSLHMGKRDYLVDSNIVRFYGRFFGFKTDGETRRQKWLIEMADSLTPERNFKAYNYALIDFTRLICATRPRCDCCSFRSKCVFYQMQIRKTPAGKRTVHI